MEKSRSRTRDLSPDGAVERVQSPHSPLRWLWQSKTKEQLDAPVAAAETPGRTSKVLLRQASMAMKAVKGVTTRGPMALALMKNVNMTQSSADSDPSLDSRRRTYSEGDSRREGDCKDDDGSPTYADQNQMAMHADVKGFGARTRSMSSLDLKTKFKQHNQAVRLAPPTPDLKRLQADKSASFRSTSCCSSGEAQQRVQNRSDRSSLFGTRTLTLCSGDGDATTIEASDNESIASLRARIVNVLDIPPSFQLLDGAEVLSDDLKVVNIRGDTLLVSLGYLRFSDRPPPGYLGGFISGYGSFSGRWLQVYDNGMAAANHDVLDGSAELAEGLSLDLLPFKFKVQMPSSSGRGDEKHFLYARIDGEDEVAAVEVNSKGIYFATVSLDQLQVLPMGNSERNSRFCRFPWQLPPGSLLHVGVYLYDISEVRLLQ